MKRVTHSNSWLLTRHDTNACRAYLGQDIHPVPKISQAQAPDLSADAAQDGSSLPHAAAQSVPAPPVSKEFMNHLLNYHKICITAF